ncbi:hypothetical protein, partial [Syntrophaceticus schinkii]|uniref:hypothetical protein n=1 Tax=Syntrophaceticus schinkii TaxID=499207 RepID=UPI001E3F1CB6
MSQAIIDYVTIPDMSKTIHFHVFQQIRMYIFRVVYLGWDPGKSLNLYHPHQSPSRSLIDFA